ncbi:MAG: signal peptide peptidase SppA [Muribaculaceae bacterium]|nr:signal peptide peptidase SppA [Muribaculaceae bacterium]
MIKKFFLSMLGSMAAIWLTFLLLFVLFITAIVVSISPMSKGPVEIEKGSVLCLDLSSPISERKGPVSIQDAIAGTLGSTQYLCDITDAIYRAAHDSRIKGIYIKADGAAAGIASMQAINEALNYFKSQPDKWIMAYGDSYAQTDYYMSSSADELWLNPQGEVDIHGLSGTVLFYKGLLDKLGVNMQIIRVGTFKSAVEPYFLTEMSPASRLQNEVYMNSIWSSIKDDIAENRGVKSETVNQWADEFSFVLPADSILSRGIVTNIGYRHQAEKRIAELAGKDKYSDVNLVDVNEYAAAQDLTDYSYLPEVKAPKKNKNTIAVLYAVGEISDIGNEGIIGNEMVDQIFELTENSEDLVGLILRVNSPGGSAFASEQIWEALQQFKEKTGLPFYVSMGDVAASGGYYISCSADRIYAQPTTITGSIGIFGMIPDIQGLMNDHLGVTTSTVQTNPNGDFPNIMRPMTPQQAEKMQEFVERGYDTFTRRVADGRHISQDSVKVIAEGRVWDGATAKKIGLVDRMGSLRSAITDMAADLKLKSYRVETYPKVEGEWWESLLTMEGINAASMTNLDPETMRLYQHLERIKNAPRVQCKVETIIIK